MLSNFFFYLSGDHRDLHSFSTRRSSDLSRELSPFPKTCPVLDFLAELRSLHRIVGVFRVLKRILRGVIRDRKSTRLNSSHVEISYAVFCLKKKSLTKFFAATKIGLVLAS